VTKKKISDPGEKRVSAGVKPVASHFTDWANPTLNIL
jgi:hypothetical protein